MPYSRTIVVQGVLCVVITTKGAVTQNQETQLTPHENRESEQHAVGIRGERETVLG